jgi:hypothetical protein
LSFVGTGHPIQRKVILGQYSKDKVTDEAKVDEENEFSNQLHVKAENDSTTVDEKRDF